MRRVLVDHARKRKRVKRGAGRKRVTLSTSMALCGDAEEASRRIGMRIGSSVLRRLIGAGGMGLVYEAEQEHPRRTVAIKVMRRGLATREILRRFEWEVEALGRLHHPGIAQVYETGTFEEDGETLPYFAMEYVRDACTLTQWVARQRLDRRARIELLATLCDAVQHGHQMGVIHRDLKPANVLVDSDGRPKVIDFGVARATRSDVALTTLQTRAGELLGTLQYMSPEQCDGDPLAIDVRSDVYSLGVILYELLCGKPPYSLDDLSIAAAARRIREEIPAVPPGLRRELRGDPEAIVLKALEKERDRRYDSAEQFAHDLRNHLAGEPNLARRASRSRRALRQVARHPVLATAVLCATLVGVSLVSMVVGARMVLSAPDAVSLDGSRGKARLVSRSGLTLAEWDVGPAGSVLLADLVEQPAELGGERLVVVGAGSDAAWEHGPEVCTFSVDRPERLLWSSARAPIVQPAGESDRPEARFVLGLVFLEDVLAESPGEELVVVHRLSTYSAQTIRVFDLAGVLRYEAWHDGGIFDVRWLPAARRLVVAALDSERRWDQLGHALGDSSAPYPVVAFALEPRDGRIGEPRWIVRGGERQDETLAWYLWLGPLEHLAVLEYAVPSFSSDAMAFDASGHVKLAVRGWPNVERLPRPQLFFVLDGEGRVVARHDDDAYKRWHDAGLLPPFSAYELLPYECLPR